MLAIFSLFLAFCLGSILYYTVCYGITPTPSVGKGKDKILSLLPEGYSGKIVDLGSGFGTLAFGLARKYKYSEITGYEISLIPFLFSRLCLNRSNLKWLQKDFLEEDLSKADIIFCYLYPGGMQKLKEKFSKHNQKECFIVSHVFAISGWKPLKVIEVGDFHRSKVYIYKVKRT